MTRDVWVCRHQQEDPTGLGLSAWPVSVAGGQCTGLQDLHPANWSKYLDSPTLVLGSQRLGEHKGYVACYITLMM